MVSSWAFAVIAFAYYLYFYFDRKSFQLEKLPSGKPQDPPSKQNIRLLSFNRDTLIVVEDNTVHWSHTFPAPYSVANDRAFLKDECYGQPDGSRVAASGRSLYEYLQREKLHKIESTLLNVPTANLPVVDKSKIFYFECQKGKIDNLFACEPGNVFDGREKCAPIDPCSSSTTAATVPDPFDVNHYYSCSEGAEAVRKKCPAGTTYVYDSCRKSPDFEAYCRNNNTDGYVQLDEKTWMQCDANKIPRIFRCPGRYFLVGRAHCEPNYCLGKQKGQLIAMDVDSTFLPPYRFSPGYYECNGDNTFTRVDCAMEPWDPIVANRDENLTMLPKVFDGTTCTEPDLCENVVYPADDLGFIVESFDYQKRIPNWPRSKLFDSVTGYRCVNSRKRKIDVPPGNVIKRNRLESACDDPSIEKVPLSVNKSAYFDCRTRMVQSCGGSDTCFDGKECVSTDPSGFDYKGTQIFRLDGLQPFTNWILPWEYSNQPQLSNCASPNTSYIPGFNVCSHPDCVKYAHVLHLEGGYAITKDGYICHAKGDELLIKSDEAKVAPGFDYWNQIGTFGEYGLSSEPQKLDKCIFGNKIQSGNFILDSTIYMTCDDRQPFVFCPSSKVRGISKIDEGAYACIPDMPETLKANTEVEFKTNQLQAIIPEPVGDTFLYEDGKTIATKIPKAGFIFDGRACKIKVTRPVTLEYKNIVTYPPNVYQKNGQWRKMKDNYILRPDGTTTKPLTLHRHKPTDVIADYKVI